MYVPRELQLRHDGAGRRVIRPVVENDRVILVTAHGDRDRDGTARSAGIGAGGRAVPLRAMREVEE